jgi:hypothetical protein
LVEIPGDKPSCFDGGLGRDELVEEVIFEVITGRAVDRSNLEKEA